MNDYILLTDEGFTFQPGTEDKLIEIENLQVIGFSSGTNSDEAFLNLLTVNPYLSLTGFEKIFCYQLRQEYAQNRKDYNLHG